MNPDSLIDELLAATDLKHAVDDPAESEYIVNVKCNSRTTIDSWTYCPLSVELSLLRCYSNMYDWYVCVAASGLQLYISRDGTAELGSRRRQQLARRDYQRVVLHPHDNRSVLQSTRLHSSHSLLPQRILSFKTSSEPFIFSAYVNSVKNFIQRLKVDDKYSINNVENKCQIILNISFSCHKFYHKSRLFLGIKNNTIEMVCEAYVGH